MSGSLLPPRNQSQALIVEGVGGKLFAQKPADNVVSNVLALEVSQAGLPSPLQLQMGNSAGRVQAGWSTGPESSLLRALAGENSSSDFL